MLNYLDGKLIDMQVKAKCFMHDCFQDERGESNIVSVLLLIVIVIGIVALFKDKLGQLVEDVFKEIHVEQLSEKP